MVQMLQKDNFKQMKKKIIQNSLFLILIIIYVYCISIFSYNLYYLINIKFNPFKAKLNTVSLKYYNIYEKDSVSIKNNTYLIGSEIYYCNKVTHATYKLSKNETAYYCSIYKNEIILSASYQNLKQSLAINFLGFLAFGYVLLIFAKDPKNIINKNLSSIWYKQENKDH